VLQTLAIQIAEEDPRFGGLRVGLEDHLDSLYGFVVAAGSREELSQDQLQTQPLRLGFPTAADRA